MVIIILNMFMPNKLTIGFVKLTKKIVKNQYNGLIEEDLLKKQRFN